MRPALPRARPRAPPPPAWPSPDWPLSLSPWQSWPALPRHRSSPSPLRARDDAPRAHDAQLPASGGHDPSHAAQPPLPPAPSAPRPPHEASPHARRPAQLRAQQSIPLAPPPPGADGCERVPHCFRQRLYRRQSPPPPPPHPPPPHPVTTRTLPSVDANAAGAIGASRGPWRPPCAQTPPRPAARPTPRQRGLPSTLRVLLPAPYCARALLPLATHAPQAASQPRSPPAALPPWPAIQGPLREAPAARLPKRHVSLAPC
mmetsp:Transcript_38920/g.102574  ORF Transcript_38920/g.102574 Transcript_38920/m.102574 type:complete len:259 (+) Transcript_38920:2912-3688(+)